MAYRDQVGTVVQDYDRVERALAKARADARFTSIRQVTLAFAFGLSWSVLDADEAPVVDYGWLDVRPAKGEQVYVDGTYRRYGEGVVYLHSGSHTVAFVAPNGSRRCASVFVYPGRTMSVSTWYSPPCL